ncbi:hypothetical protein Btru_010170 [Bulinus truncatus]|nr:hypothetical protein Btru_010170 [Bulinus truncatus]
MKVTYTVVVEREMSREECGIGQDGDVGEQSQCVSRSPSSSPSLQWVMGVTLSLQVTSDIPAARNIDMAHHNEITSIATPSRRNLNIEIRYNQGKSDPFR